MVLSWLENFSIESWECVLFKSEKRSFFAALFAFDFFNIKHEGVYFILGVQRQKKFCRPPEASIGRMIEPLGVRRVQIIASNPPMLNYTCDEHVVNTRWLKVKKWSTNVGRLEEPVWTLLIPNHLIIRPILASGGRKNHFFVSIIDSWKNYFHF